MKVISDILNAETLRVLGSGLGIEVFVSRTWKTRAGKNAIAFTLGLGKSRHYQRKGYSGRRIWAVCYHGHRDFMQALFNADNFAILSSAMIRYEGREDFNANYRSIGDRNIGSVMSPLYYSEACYC